MCVCVHMCMLACVATCVCGDSLLYHLSNCLFNCCLFTVLHSIKFTGQGAVPSALPFHTETHLPIVKSIVKQLL